MKELSWHEHVVDKHSDWSGDWESQPDPKTPTSKEKVVDENNNWNDDPQEAESTESQEIQCLSPSSSSGISSIQYDGKLARVPIRITHLVSPTEFTVQKLSSADEFLAFQNEVQKVATGQSPMTVFEMDKYCLAFNTLEEMWIRGIFVDVHLTDFLVTVKCLDTGSTFSIVDQKHLKNIPGNLVFFTPSFAYRCSLPIRHDLKKEDKISGYLINKKDENLSCQFITKFGATGLHFIELFHGDLNVTDYFVQHGYAKRQVIVPTDYAQISYVTNHRQFAIVTEGSLDILLIIMRYAESYKMIEVAKPEVNMLVMVLKQNKFHRGRIINITGEKIRVYLVDIGEYTVVDKVGEIDVKAIAEIPPIAIKCSLVLPSSAANNKEVSRKFKQFACKGKRIFVSMVQPGDECARVDISDHNESGALQNITSFLLQN